MALCRECLLLLLLLRAALASDLALQRSQSDRSNDGAGWGAGSSSGGGGGSSSGSSDGGVDGSAASRRLQQEQQKQKQKRAAGGAEEPGRRIVFFTQFGPIKIKLLETTAPNITGMLWDLAVRRGCNTSYNCAFYRWVACTTPYFSLLWTGSCCCPALMLPRCLRCSSLCRRCASRAASSTADVVHLPPHLPSLHHRLPYVYLLLCRNEGLPETGWGPPDKWGPPYALLQGRLYDLPKASSWVAAAAAFSSAPYYLCWSGRFAAWCAMWGRPYAVLHGFILRQVGAAVAAAFSSAHLLLPAVDRRAHV